MVLIEFLILIFSTILQNSPNAIFVAMVANQKQVIPNY